MAIAVPFIGAAIGSAIGGTFLGVAAASWGWLAGSLLASALFRPPNQRGPLLEDRVVAGTAYGQAIPAVYGSPRLAGQYVWASEVRPIANTQKVGKGGGQKVTTFTYEVDLMIMLTENTTEGVARDWLNGELVRNELTVKEGVWTGVTVYTGADDQLPDPTYEAAVGAGNASAYRGHTTIVVRGLQLGQGKQLPNLEHQVNTLSGLDLSGVIIDAPFNDVVEAEDQADDPLDGTVTGPTVAFLPDRVVIGPEDDSIAFIGGKASGDSYGGQPRFYMAFDYSIDETTPGSLPGGLQEFFSLPTGEIGRVRWLTQYEADGNLKLEGQNFYAGAGGSASIAEFPPSGRFALVWPEGTSGEIEVYLDNVLVTTATSSGNMRNWEQITFLVSSGVPSGRHVSRQSYANFYFGIGFDPVYQPPLEENLGSVLSDLMARAGYDATEYEVDAALEDTILHGYQTGDITSTRAHLETLRPFGKYESYCTDKIYIFPRATTPAGTIDWEDLGASEGLDPMDPFVLDAGNENEMPAQIALRYRNVSADWNVGTEFSNRIRSSQDSTQTVDMPFGMTPAQAKSTVESMLLDMMAGLGRVALSTGGRKYAKFNPGDVVTTTNPAGRTYRLRILTKRDSLIRIEFECVLDDASVLNPPDTTYEGYVSTTTPVAVAPTAWEIANIPPLRDADAEAPGPYVAVTPLLNNPSDEWPGAVFVRARLPEAFEQVFISGDAAVIGETTTVLADYSGNSGTMQKTGKVRVAVRGELSSSTWEDFFVDRTINACMFGDEPCRFLIADFVSTDGILNTYDLSQIMRGQLGQEHEIVEHAVGTRFVLLNNSIRKMVNETTDIDVEQQVKAVTLNTLLSAVDAEDFTDSGIALKPYSPWVLRALQDGSDIEVTWDRRSRRVARYTTAGVFAPLGELVEAYRLKVYDGVTLVRTENLTSPAYTYLAADITSDGFAPGDPITITVQQLSDTVGEGFATTVETAAP